MFCYKCGKQISDQALFCEHCGSKTVYMSQPANQNLASQPVAQTYTAPLPGQRASDIGVEESSKKMTAVACFAIFTLLQLFLLWSGVITKGDIFFGELFPDFLLNRLWEEIAPVYIVLAVLFTVGAIVNWELFFFLPLKRRTFLKQKPGFVGSVLGDISAVVLLLIYSSMFYKDSDSLPVLFILLCIIVAGAAIVCIATYVRAANAERLPMVDLNTGTTISPQSDNSAPVKEIPEKIWVCKKCRARNSVKNSVCFSCGNVNDGKSLSSRLADISATVSEESQDLWVCRKCGAKNSKLQAECKSCGQYK